MTDYRETLSLKGQRISQGIIAVSYSGSRNTADNVLQQASHLACQMPLVRAAPKTQFVNQH